MVKLYLRYGQKSVFGVIASSGCNVVYDAEGQRAITGALEAVNIWNLRQSVLSSRLVDSGESGKIRNVTMLERSPDRIHVAAGYSDGSVRIWHVNNKVCSMTLTGHKSAVTSLRYNAAGTFLASGSRDTDIVLWDIVQESGVVRLKGHKDAVTDLKFLEKSKRLVSGSKDTFVKIWDLPTQFCTHTIVGHRAEIWSLDIDPNETRIAVASGDNPLRVWVLPSPEATVNAEVTEVGLLDRLSKQRGVSLRFHPTHPLLACLNNDRTVEFWRVLSEKEVSKKLKRGKRKADAKKAKQENESESAMDTGEAGVQATATDEFARAFTLRSSQKIRSFAFHPTTLKVLVSLANNSLEVYDISTLQQATKVFDLEAHGHRSDIRALTLSSDDALICSAANGQAKVWSTNTQSCLKTFECGYALCATFLPGNQHVAIGTKEGALEIFELQSNEIIERLEEAHSASIWSMHVSPDKKGLVTASADKNLKFWDFQLVARTPTSKRLGISFARSLKLTDDVLCVRFSADQKLIALSLLDSTIKVYYADTLKFFLSLYGHKLPALTLDISSDGNLLASGSADKNIKIWGLDFGDCRRSIFAHQDSIMQVQFVPNTHYLFSVSKDRTVKYWDVDKFQQLLTLDGHHGEIWALAVGHMGEFAVTASHDKSIRIWERTDQQFVLEEAKEELLNAQLDAEAREEPLTATSDDKGNLASKRTAESLMAGEKLMEAITLADNERSQWATYHAALALAEQQMNAKELRVRKAKGEAILPLPVCNPLLQGRSPSDYLLKVLQSVRSAELEEALLVLPFTSICRLFEYFLLWVTEGKQIELVCRCMFFLLRVHQSQIVATRTLLPCLTELRALTRDHLKNLKDIIGFNRAALDYLKRTLEVEITAPIPIPKPKKQKTKKTK